MEDEPLSSDERAAENAAQEQQQAVAAAILSALLLLRPQVTTVTYWIPVTWDEFKQMAGSAIDPAFTAFDKAAKAVWMGFDPLDAVALEAQRRYRDDFAAGMVDTTRRAVEKSIEWGRAHGLGSPEMDAILKRVTGLNGNQLGPILDEWLTLRNAGAGADVLDRMLKDAVKTAAKDRAGTVAGDVLWDQVQAGRLHAGKQEQRATNAAIVKRWVTAMDERVCETCGPLHGVTVAINAAFPGGIMAPRLHSHCRCRMRIEIAEEGAF